MMSKKYRFTLTLLAVFFFCFVLALPAQAARRRNTWVVTKS